jgi:ribosomal protein S18 acetylase RimI-like enzyme
VSDEPAAPGTTYLGYAFAGGPDEARRADVTERLQEFNRAHLAVDPVRDPLELYVLDPAGSVVGGLVGGTVWGWLEIAALWIDEAHRGRGLGEALTRRAEAEARRRGCAAARLSTWDFQALGFYQRLGYVPYGRLDGYPPGRTVHYLRRELADGSALGPGDAVLSS